MAKPPPKASASPKAAAGKGSPPSSKAAGKGRPDSDALHAPLEMKSRTHEEMAQDAKRTSRGKGQGNGAKEAKAHLERRQKMSRTKQLAVLMTLPLMVLGVLGIYTVLWFNAAHTVRNIAHEALAGEYSDKDWSLGAKTASGEDAEVSISGFPLKIIGTLPGVAIKAPERWGGWSLSSATLRLEGKAWGRNEVRIHPQGKTTLTLASGRSFDLTATDLSLLLGLGRGDTVNTLTLSAKDLTIQPPSGAAPAVIASFELAGSALPVSGQADSHTPTYEGSLTVRDASLPPDMAPPIGPSIRSLEIQGRLLGLLGNGPSLREKMNKWRDDGGVAELDRLYLNWSPLQLAATGTIALDDHLQPVGALSSQMQGYLEAADGLYKGKLMRARDLTLSRVVLNSMAEMKDGVPTLTTPMSVQNGQLLLGPVTVTELPTLSWPPSAEGRELPALRPNYQVDRWGNVSRQD